MVDKFSLKWNNFHVNISKSFEALRKEEYLLDVTLVGDDYKPVLAHKLVLSACSEYFQNIFKMNQNEHHKFPLICLSGMMSDDIKNILDYIYYGEVQVYQEQIDSFLDIAQRLKLNGIKAIAAAINESNPDEEPLKDTCKDLIEPPKIEPEEDSFVEPELIDLEDTDSNISLNKKIQKYIGKDEDGNYKCNQCGKICKRKSTLRAHIEIHIPGLEFSCNMCDKAYKTRSSLYLHRGIKHIATEPNNESETKDHSWIL